MADFTQISSQKPDYSGYTDLLSNFMQGYQAQALPRQMKAQQEAQALKNKLMQSQAEWYPRNQQMQYDVNSEKLNQLRNPVEQMPKGNKLLQYQFMIDKLKSVDPNDPRIKQLEQASQKEATRGNGITVYDANGMPTTQIGGELSNLGRLPVGQNYYYKTDDSGKEIIDPQGNKIPEGVMVPTTAEEKKEIEGRYVMDKVLPKVSEIESIYSGNDGIKRFWNDTNNAATDPEAHERMIQFALAKKLSAPLTAKEQQTLGASNTLGQFRVLQSALKSTNVPSVLKSYSSYKIPSDINLEANKRFLQTINDVTKGANQQVPYFQKRPFEIKQEGQSKEKTFRNSKTGEVLTESQMKERGFM